MLDTEIDLPGDDDEATSVHRAVMSPPQDFDTPVRTADSFYPAPGKRLGKYELREKIAQGTFGLVFRARDTNLDRDVALKLLNPQHIGNRDILHRFLQEARAAARVGHPGIVTMLDCGQFDTCAFIAMELLQGESLTQRLARSGRLAPTVAAEIARQIASALDAAHRADVLHRDLKPDNIYIVPDPAMAAGERIKILDFGLAKVGQSGQTMVNTVFGTPRYMSPEQCRSATNIDQRSDIYALGCVLFELVTGRPPFDGNLRELVDRHQRAPIPRPRTFAPDCPTELEDLLYRMLAKDPAARPQTMGMVVAILQSLGALTPGVEPTLISMAQLMSLPPPPAPLPHAPSTLPSETARRSRIPMLAAVAAIAFVIAGAVTAVAARPAKPASDRVMDTTVSVTGS